MSEFTREDGCGSRPQTTLACICSLSSDISKASARPSLDLKLQETKKARLRGYANNVIFTTNHC